MDTSSFGTQNRQNGKTVLHVTSLQYKGHHFRQYVPVGYGLQHNRDGHVLVVEAESHIASSTKMMDRADNTLMQQHEL